MTAELRVLHPEPLHVDRDAMAVYVGGREVRLRLTEYNALCFLLENEGRMRSHRAIAAAGSRDPYVTNSDWYSDKLAKSRARTLVTILRRAIAGSDRRIVGMHGVGYRLERES